VKSVYYLHGLSQKRAPLKKNLYLKFKRWIDVIAALGLLIILSPLLIVIGLLIKLESPGPLLFKQIRLGLDSKPFTIYKFRTMVNHAPRNIPTNALNDPHTYVTRIGRFLRLFSLDELPQLINILRHDMSMIGPRPVIPEETDLIERRKALGADQILPGVTGYAQINGRDDLDYVAKSDYDAYYVQNVSASLDLKIIVLSVFKILKSEHVSH
jgi:O-antigen biosynthesis protein WbqP